MYKIGKKLKAFLTQLLGIEKIVTRCIEINELRNQALTSKERLVNDKTGGVIVSLTTYGARINDVHLVIESLGRQYIKSNKIILWLDSTEFTIDSIPSSLMKQIERGLEVRFCENLKSYKKLLPAIENYPDRDIITVDDDVIYPYYFLELLLKDAEQYPKTVICYRAHKIKLTANGTVDKYERWEVGTIDREPGILIFPTGCGGVYYPKNSLFSECLKYEKASQLASTGDDIWFKAMSIKNSTLSKVVNDHFDYDNDFIDIPSAYDSALSHVNIFKGENNKQIKRVFGHYAINFEKS